MVTTAYDIGDVRSLKGTFADASGTLTNPTTIALVIKEPDGTLTTKAIGDLTTTATGVYTYVFTISQSGRHIVNWTSTGSVAVAAETEFYVRKKGAIA